MCAPLTLEPLDDAFLAEFSALCSAPPLSPKSFDFPAPPSSSDGACAAPPETLKRIKGKLCNVFCCTVYMYQAIPALL